MALGATHVLVTPDGDDDRLIFAGDQGAIEYAEQRPGRYAAVYTREMTLIWGHDDEQDLRPTKP